MKAFITILFSIFCFHQIQAQNIYFSESGTVTFSSTTIFETFHAENNQVPALLDIENGQITFSALIQSFKFKNRLMEKQFNEYIIDSESNPRANFKGRIINIKEIDFNDYSPKRVEIEGRMYLNGTKKTICIFGVIHPQKDQVTGNSTFILNPSDFDIKIPQPLEHKIATDIYVSVNVTYKPYKQ